MSAVIKKSLENDLLTRGFTRRHFARISSLLSAGSAMTFFNEAAMAQLSMIGPLPADAVKINANENPLGPCPEALEALFRVAKNGGRYQYEETFQLRTVAAAQEGLKPEYLMPFAGSSLPLHQSVIAFTSPAKGLVTADPGYEAAARAAEYIGAPVKRIPLIAGAKQDIKAMVSADPNAGVIYICNPNNPTGVPVPRQELEWAYANKPAGAILLVDEAYLHFSGEPSMADYVAQDKDVVILRTFSKLYGMAGLRAGFAFGRPDLLEKFRGMNSGAMPVTGMAAASASLKVPDLVATRRKINQDTRDDVLAWLDGKGYSFTPSKSNKFMVDVKMPAEKFISGMARQKVYVGRKWPAWPTHVRITVGTPQEMAKFKSAFEAVTA